MYLFVGELVAHDDDLITYFTKVCSRAVECDYARAAFARQGIRLKTIAVVDIRYKHLLTQPDTCLVQEVLVHGDASLVVESGLCDRSPMDLAAEHPTHDFSIVGSIISYSLMRVTIG